MDNGFIIIHRKIRDWGWYKKSEMVHLFLHLLLLANHEPGEWQGHKINRGQLITGRHNLSKDTGISPQTIRTCLNKLKSTSEITIKSTNKFSIITILKYSDYQDKREKSTSKLTNKLTNNQPTTNQQLTTNNNVNNVNNEEQIYSEPSSQVNEIFNIFYNTINRNINFGNKTQRRAVEDLIKLQGFEKVKSVAEFACKVHGQKYAPTITTPTQLKEKWSALEGWAKKKVEETKSNSIKFVS